MNINKSLALKHQQMMCKNENTYTDEISMGAKKELTDVVVRNHVNLFTNHILEMDEVKWLRFNGVLFKKDLMILHESRIFEIEKIICIDGVIHFFCSKINNLGLDTYLNSLEIQPSVPTSHILLSLNNLEHTQSYHPKKCNGKCYLIADTLEVNNIVKD